MSLTDYVIMPGTDYQSICDAVREKTGGTDVIKSGDMAGQIEGIESVTWKVVVEEQDVTVTSDTTNGCYSATITSLESVVNGEIAIVEWDGTSYQTYAKEVILKMGTAGVTSSRNNQLGSNNIAMKVFGTAAKLQSSTISDFPFQILVGSEECYVYTADTEETTHKVKIYKLVV